MSESLFTSQTPIATDPSDGTPGIVRATTIQFAVAGTVAGIRWWCPVTNTGNVEVRIWQLTSTSAGTLLATKAITGTPTGGAWNVTTFDTPVPVDAAHVYRVTVFNNEGRYVATNSFFVTPLVVGDLTAEADHADVGHGVGVINQGTFAISATDTFPSNVGVSACYFVDVVFNPGAVPTVDIAANFAAAGSMAAAVRAEPTLSATLSTAGAMSASLTVPFTPTDPIGSPVAAELMACFTAQLAELPNPPRYIQMRVGQDTGPLIGENVDECCAGLAWVRIASIYPSWDSFPSADNTWTPCGPLAYAVQLEMGVAFCMPWSSTDEAIDNQDPPSTADWALAASTQMIHQTLMRRTAACCWRPTQRRAVGEWSPLPVEGGCTGGKLLVTVSVMAPCSDC